MNVFMKLCKVFECFVTIRLHIVKNESVGNLAYFWKEKYINEPNEVKMSIFKHFRQFCVNFGFFYKKIQTVEKTLA